MLREPSTFRLPARPFRRAAAATPSWLAPVILAAGLAAVALPGPALGQRPADAGDAMVVGVVRSATGDRPMADVAVRFLEADYTMVTSADGSFHADHLPPGRHTVQLRYMGLASRQLALTLTDGDVVELAFEVDLDPMRIQELQVQATGTRHGEPMAGFWRRRMDGRGAFLGDHDLAGMGDTPVTSVLRGFQGVTLERCEQPPGAAAFARSLTDGRRPDRVGAVPRTGAEEGDQEGGGSDRRRDGAGTDSEGIARPDVALPAEDPHVAYRPGCQTVRLRADGDRCRPRLYVEGRLAVAAGADPAAVDDLLTGLRARELLGIEVYRTAGEAPPLFQRSGDDCGAVVLWLRAEAPAEEAGAQR